MSGLQAINVRKGAKLVNIFHTDCQNSHSSSGGNIATSLSLELGGGGVSDEAMHVNNTGSLGSSLIQGLLSSLH